MTRVNSDELVDINSIFRSTGTQTSISIGSKKPSISKVKKFIDDNELYCLQNYLEKEHNYNKLHVLECNFICITSAKLNSHRFSITYLYNDLIHNSSIDIICLDGNEEQCLVEDCSKYRIISYPVEINEILDRDYLIKYL
jgi:hypothetical protein